MVSALKGVETVHRMEIFLSKGKNQAEVEG
jgi:hypothetical protein